MKMLLNNVKMGKQRDNGAYENCLFSHEIYDLIDDEMKSSVKTHHIVSTCIVCLR
jgi:hypothetical protein